LRISADLTLRGRYQIDINHAASIQFGQLVEIHWKFKDEQHAHNIGGGIDFIILDEADKQCVRENIMGALYEQIQNKPIIKQYIRSLKNICAQDYPAKLPNLFTQVMSYLNQHNQLSIYTGLLGLFALAARFEFELDEDREPLFEIIKCSFEKLGNLVNDMVNNRDNPDALYMMHLVCKVFYVSN
jgi:hypothetical protein